MKRFNRKSISRAVGLIAATVFAESAVLAGGKDAPF